MVKKNSFFEGLNLFNNKSAKKSYNGILIIAGIFGVLFLMNFTFAILSTDGQNRGLTPHAVSLYNTTAFRPNGTTVDQNFTINEGITAQIIINVSRMVGNLTNDFSNSTIAQVNITFDKSFVIDNPPNYSHPYGTANLTGNDTLTGRTFSWLNASGQTTPGNISGILSNQSDMNGTITFNMSNAVPGKYNITVLLSNITFVGLANFSIKINDTTAPNFVNFDANSTGFSSITPIYSFAGIPSTTTKVNLSTSATSATTIYTGLNVTDFNETGAGGIGYAGQGVLRASFYFYNDTGLMNESHNRTGTGSNVRENFGFNLSTHTGGAANLTDGNYMIVIRNFTEIGNNTNTTAIAYNVTIDGTQPTLTIAKSSTSNQHQLVLDLTVSDATSGINGKQCITTGGGTDGITMSGNTGTQTATQTGLGCNTAYTYTVACTDHSGNTKSSGVTLSTSTCTGGGGTSGTSGGTSGSDVVGSASSSYWTLTYNEATTDLNADSDGVSVNLDEQYRVKIKVDTKLYYVGVTETTDTTVKLNVTTTAEDKEATLNVGEIKKFDVNADDKYDVAVTLNGIDSATGKADLSLVYIQEAVSAEEQAGVGEQVGEVPTTSETKSKTWIWVIVILVVLAIAAAILFGKKQSKHKNYGF